MNRYIVCIDPFRFQLINFLQNIFFKKLGYIIYHNKCFLWMNLVLSLKEKNPTNICFPIFMLPASVNNLLWLTR